MDRVATESRRYPEGQYPLYDLAFQALLDKSFTNDPESLEKQGLYFQVDTLQDCEDLYEQYTDRGGDLLNNVGSLSDNLTRLEHARADVEKFEREAILQKQISANQGRRSKGKPIDGQLEAEARYDVRKFEQGWLLQNIEDFNKTEESSGDRERLRLMNSVPLGSVERIDYETGTGHISHMKVELVDSMPCIVDRVSPYNGMSVLDFREFVLPAYNLSQRNLFKQRHKAWLESDQKKPQPTLRKTMPEWPAWPEGITNYLNEGS